MAAQKRKRKIAHESEMVKKSLKKNYEMSLERFKNQLLAAKDEAQSNPELEAATEQMLETLDEKLKE